MLGHHRHASERFAGGPMMVPLIPLTNFKKRVKVGPPLTKLSGSAHAMYLSIRRTKNKEHLYFSRNFSGGMAANSESRDISNHLYYIRQTSCKWFQVRY